VARSALENSIRAELRRSFADQPPESPLAGPRTAAIALILLVEQAGLEALLIERATRDGDPWSGHMALPGGHAEPSDADLGATAERETLEEVGLDLRAAAERLGRLSDCEPVRGVPIAVRPFVYLLEHRPTLTLSAEVRRGLWVPTLPLQRGERRATHTFERAGRDLEFPAWDVDGRIVWGLTYRVLDEFFRRFNAVFGPQS
jgi:8-oxo-dGTP pyrophosphatase MutT (NUDIX family)